MKCDKLGCILLKNTICHIKKNLYIWGAEIKQKTMKTLEFKTKIKGNRILIPREMQPELAFADNGKNVRVIVYIDDADEYDTKVYSTMAAAQFLKGYAETDAIYD
jgi:hypothetical protein